MFSILRILCLIFLPLLLVNLARATVPADANWVSMCGVSSADGEVRALTHIGTDIYVAGNFSTVCGVPANNIAKWNGLGWTVLGAGINGPVFALAKDGAGNLYAGGSFTMAGGVNAMGVARWDGVSWSALGSGVYGGSVLALAVDSGGALFVGGSFTSAGGIAYLAKWNGIGWSQLGDGINDGPVKTLVVDSDDNVFAGGQFGSSGLLNNLYGFAKWDGVKWSGMGLIPLAPSPYPSVKSLAADANGNMYVSGYFTSDGLKIYNGIARWRGSSGWSVVASGTQYASAGVTALAVDQVGDLYAGGTFTTINSVSANRIAKWNGSNWITLASGVNNVINLLDIDDGHNLIAAGSFTLAGGKASMQFAKWFTADNDGDGVSDAVDIFPSNPAEWLDTDDDGVGNNADVDDDNDSVPDYIDADPLNAAVHNEKILPLNRTYQGSSINENVMQQ